MNQNNTIESNNLIIGRNPVMEALKSERAIDYIITTEKIPTGSLKPIIAKAKDIGIPIKNALRKKLDLLAGTTAHQGIIAIACEKEYCDIQDILDLSEKRNEPPFIVIADGIEDPHNLGAIIRTAECAGVHGIIIPKRRAVGLTSTVTKASAGAIEHMLICRATNISAVIDKLKKLNIWVYGAEAGGLAWCKQTLSGPIALVVGSEGKGISKLVKDKCDAIISLPMFGNINSLNVSAATAIMIYEIVKQRNY